MKHIWMYGTGGPVLTYSMSSCYQSVPVFSFMQDWSKSDEDRKTVEGEDDVFLGPTENQKGNHSRKTIWINEWRSPANADASIKATRQSVAGPRCCGFPTWQCSVFLLIHSAQGSFLWLKCFLLNIFGSRHSLLSYNEIRNLQNPNHCLLPVET